MDETFGDLPCVTGITDDIVVYGYKSDFSDHDENLCVVLQHAARLVFASTWTNVDSGALKFPSLAIIIGAKGLQHDPRKINSILSMDPSTSLADLNIPWDGPARKLFHS